MGASFRRFVDLYPTDLAIVSLFVPVAILVIELLPPVSTLRFLIALPFLVFLPGYACLALLFPGTAESADPRWTGLNRGIDGVERGGLSFGLSLAIAPLVLVGVGAFQPLSLEVILGTLAIFTLVCTQGAFLRRLQLPADQRYGFHPVASGRAVYARLFTNRGVVGQAAALVLVLGLVLGAGSVAFAVANPPDANAFTEFYVGTVNDDGDVVTAGYPDTIGVGESARLTFAVENHERSSQQYHVVVQLQRVEDGEVVALNRQASFEETVPAGESWQRTHEVSPEQTGENLRITYLLYVGEPPDDPTQENAYRYLHVWIEVEA